MTVTRRTVAKTAAWTTPVLVVGAAAPAMAASPCPNAGSTTYSYTGAIQTWTVPTCITQVQFRIIGGSGGSASTAAGRGLAEVVTGTISVTQGQQLTLWVAGAGTAPVAAASAAGGWGFGSGGSITGVSSSGSAIPSCSGGGGSAITRAGQTVAVAGGGGGAGGAVALRQQNNGNGWQLVASVTSLSGFLAGTGSAGIPAAAGPVQQLTYINGATTYSQVAVGFPGAGATATAPGAGGTGYQKLDSQGNRFTALGTSAGGAGTGPSTSGGTGGAGASWSSTTGSGALGVGGAGGGGYTGGGGGSAAGFTTSLTGNYEGGMAGYGGGGSSYAAPAVTGGNHALATTTGNGSITLTYS